IFLSFVFGYWFFGGAMLMRTFGFRSVFFTTFLQGLSVSSAVALLFLAWGCQRGPQPQAAPPPPPPPEVVVINPVQRDVPVYSEWIGTTDGAINAQIRARVQGYLEYRHYREGTAVKT